MTISRSNLYLFLKTTRGIEAEKNSLQSETLHDSLALFDQKHNFCTFLKSKNLRKPRVIGPGQRAIVSADGQTRRISIVVVNDAIKYFHWSNPIPQLMQRQ